MSVCYCVDRFYVVCADMAAQYTVPDSANPGKMFMNYQGLASYLSSGGTSSEYIVIYKYTYRHRDAAITTSKPRSILTILSSSLR